ncbi:uncharacterized protein EI90DRAFT_3133944 [Cantharellus anzutake]|uniref:uncharacterized protein n=1 Tax=Cantharellus anzutake TaxID=1750568 RepID=UPI001908AD35|nr:uncharacterized protein EI90DRAFT_3133944 [Cantharellus anzutake]KAF8317297.1 hypothetical protein EI90DRAFT_3133944 [Cantharellus anzutake]
MSVKDGYSRHVAWKGILAKPEEFQFSIIDGLISRLNDSSKPHLVLPESIHQGERIMGIMVKHTHRILGHLSAKRMLKYSITASLTSPPLSTILNNLPQQDATLAQAIAVLCQCPSNNLIYSSSATVPFENEFSCTIEDDVEVMLEEVYDHLDGRPLPDGLAKVDSVTNPPGEDPIAIQAGVSDGACHGPEIPTVRCSLPTPSPTSASTPSTPLPAQHCLDEPITLPHRCYLFHSPQWAYVHSLFTLVFLTAMQSCPSPMFFVCFYPFLKPPTISMRSGD